MANRAFVFTHHRMATTARFGQVLRGFERLYYSLLFVTPAYGGRPEKWSRWLAMGFGVNIRQHPTSAAPADEMKSSTRSEGATTTVTVTAGNAAILGALEQLLRDIDAVRAAVRGKGEAERWASIQAAAPIRAKLLEPVTQSLQRDNLPQRDIDDFLAALRETLEVLTEDNIAAIESPAMAAAR